MWESCLSLGRGAGGAGIRAGPSTHNHSASPQVRSCHQTSCHRGTTKALSFFFCHTHAHTALPLSSLGTAPKSRAKTQSDLHGPSHLPRVSTHSDPCFSSLSRAGECPATRRGRPQQWVSGECGCAGVGCSVSLGHSGSLGRHEGGSVWCIRESVCQACEGPHGVLCQGVAGCHPKTHGPDSAISTSQHFLCSL